jgi:hypothetical protein
MGFSVSKKLNDQYGDKETKRRFDATLKGRLAVAEATIKTSRQRRPTVQPQL